MKSTLLALCLAVVGTGCATSSHDFQKSALGVTKPASALLAELDAPGPVELETITSCDWAVERGGLINLDHPTAKAAQLKDDDEPIQVFFHALRHPSQGLYIVDTGMETALRDAPDRSAMRGIVASQMHMEKMKVLMPLGEWLAKQPKPVAGVFLTHLHPDHITGMADVPAGTPVFTGPGEAAKRNFVNLFVQGAVDRALEGKPALSEWNYTADPQGLFEGAVDIFGDGSVWALWVPGHTPGSTAYLVRSTKGPVLLLGDASHTRWGWEHDVEPGTFTQDGPRSVESFRKLRAFVAAHPGVEVRFGHQH
ncbi:MBL fold metallo-hydrolase [Corallococcus praedator]|uniref:MBL fold metallo-hydrolase n=1 Tax=Corallococcus praedator TaxID=2316724 RepID=A0ABX9QGU7_9BACT|nr:MULTISPECIES: MBL fold metallo-hydrolase [Corallococcus]RKH18690.1 MBL fold metallo-hydrolase [Corallococcus sp. CA047B]RKH33756.1 MBL fold metallo-hydrolase [Corallococcus sp. CA031C]RKI07586.1 MBL fold metallo-hydrolase [Corallococcus praedator]